ncbi:hypothetical protein DPMN_063724 [Dreissena polymorpha]|uniref:Uncharacterized protein n=1 Tax=Dreissena polymorpha TaxID=45954 RepID=A0A9D4CBX3_DREPO|nr:hypothetical protein DPMN_063724 [Dreissena polymorpha]
MFQIRRRILEVKICLSKRSLELTKKNGDFPEMMESSNETKVRNDIWRRISRGMRGEKVSELAERSIKMFSLLATCVRPARSKDPDVYICSPITWEKSSKLPIYRGPQITVPWTGPVCNTPHLGTSQTPS